MTTQAQAAMILKADRDVMVDALKPLTRFVGKVTTMVTTHIHFVVNGSTAYAESTNARVGARIRLSDTPEVSAGESIDVLVPTLIVDALRAMPKGELQMEFTDAKVIITGGRKARFEIPVRWDDFPEIGADDAEEITGDEFDIGALGDIVGAMSKFASKDDKKPSIQGVNLRMGDDGNMWAWSTDSIRFHRSRTALPDFLGDLHADVTLPTGLDGDIKALFSGSARVDIGTQLRVTDGTSTYISHLTAEPYPQIQRMIPKDEDFTGTVTFDRDEAKTALERVGVVVPDNTLVVVSILDGEMLIRAATVSGSAEEAWEAEVGDCRMEIGYNLGNLSDAVEAMPNGTMTFKVTTSLRPTIVLPGDGVDPDRQHMLMPIRTTPTTGGGSATRKKGGKKAATKEEDE